MYRRNSWFPTVFDEFLNSDLMNTVSTTAPSVNVKETEKAYIVELAAPGVRGSQPLRRHREQVRAQRGRQTLALSAPRVLVHQLRAEIQSAGRRERRRNQRQGRRRYSDYRTAETKESRRQDDEAD